MDPQSFACEWAANRRRLWSLAVGLLGHRQDAEDLMQEAAAVAYRRRDDFTPGTSFGAWTARIVRNLALNARRKRSRRQHDVGGDAVESLTASGANGAVTEAFDDRLDAALATLSPDARACLLMRTLEGLDYRTIAETLEIPEGTAMSHVHRSRKKLREMLSGADEPERTA
ncbi:MAG: RNA polymerase sigma factor [Planctomycetota bacterium]